MADFYQYFTAAMLSCVAFSYLKFKHVHVICILVLLSFLTFHVIDAINLDYLTWVALDSLRVSSLIVVCFVFAQSSKKVTPYLCYSLVLLGFVVANGLFLINPALAPEWIYVALTMLELALFIQGMSAVISAKTKNDSIHNSDNNSFRYFARRWLSRNSNSI